MKILEKILFYGLIVTLFISLFVDQEIIFPFVTSKAFLFYIIIDILLLCYLILLTKQPLYPQKNKLMFVFIAMIILGWFLDLFGISFKSSFWGNYERMVGIYTAFHFLAYLWMLLSVFNTRIKYYKLLNISLIVSVLVSIFGILQKFAVPVFGILQTRDYRISSTFGNPAYLAGWLLFFIFLAVYLFIKNKNKYWRILYIVSLVINLLVLNWTVTRGALLGLMAGIVAMLFYLVLFYKTKKIKIISAGVLVLIILFASSIFVFKDSSFVQNNSTLSRISQISLTDTTTASRLSLWNMSIQAVKEKPIFGYGANNIRVPLDKYHDYNLIEDWFDSSHNKFFDELLAHGIIGFVLQIGFFIWLLILILKKRKKDILGNMALFGLLIAYLVQALFIFDSFIVGLSSIFIFGFLFVKLRDSKQEIIFKKTIPIYIVVPLLIVIAWMAIFVYSNSQVQAKKIITAHMTVNSDIGQTIDNYQELSSELYFNFDILAPAMAETTMIVFENPNKYTDVQLKNFVEVLTEIYNKAIDDTGNYSKFYINIAKLYQLIDQRSSLEYSQKSIELLNTALDHSPGRIDIYYALAQGYFLLDDIPAAENSLQIALGLEVRQGEVYHKLAEIQARKGDTGQALDSIRQAIAFDKEYEFIDLENFAQIFIKREAWEAVLEVFLILDEIKPNNIDTFVNIALTYSQLDNKEKAIEWINKVLEIDPTKQEQVDEFISNL